MASLPLPRSSPALRRRREVPGSLSSCAATAALLSVTNEQPA